MSSVGHTSCEQWHWGVQRRGRTFHGAVSLFEEGWEAETVGTCSVSPFFFFNHHPLPLHLLSGSPLCEKAR